MRAASNPDQLYIRASVILMAVLGIVILWTFKDYGVSWDDPLQHSYGEAVLRYYTSLFRDRSALSMENGLHYYGAFYEVVAVLATRVLPFQIFDTRHLVTAIAGLLAILGTWKLAALVHSPGAAFWSTLLIALYPSFYGHMFINSKDIPFAAFYVWSLYYLIQWLQQSQRASLAPALKLALTSGLAMAVRVPGMVLLVYLFVFTVLHSGVTRRTVAGLVTVVVVSYSVMLVFWPYGMSKPFVRPISTLLLFSSSNPDAPLDYIPRYWLIKTPELVIVILVLTIVLVTMKVFRSMPYFILAVSVLFPIAYAILKRVMLYDEIRQMLFVMPPLYCLAGITTQHLLDSMSRSAALKRVTLVLLSGYLALHAIDAARRHPYEYMYYNRIVGGLPGAAAKGYETDYWVTGYREAIKDLEAHLGDQQSYMIFVSSAPWSALPDFPANFKLTNTIADAGVYLATTRAGVDRWHSGSEAVVVQRLGVPIVVAKLLPSLAH